VKTVSQCWVSIYRKLYLKLRKIEGKGAHAVRDERGDVTRTQFLKLKLQFMANRGPAQRNGFHCPALVFYAESESINNSYQ